MKDTIIPIFYACDDAFVKYTVVSMYSMISNASKEYKYVLHILHTEISDKMIKARTTLLENFDESVSEKLKSHLSERPVFAVHLRQAAFA